MMGSSFTSGSADELQAGPLANYGSAHSPILVLPLDARPVCYQALQQLGAFSGLSLVLPPKELLGQLKRPAPLGELKAWLASTLNKVQPAAAVVSLDLLAYGGLIAGRVSNETLDTLKQRLEKALALFEAVHCKVWAYSTILRLPSYNNAEEEPDYWARYGATLAKHSVQLHQSHAFQGYDTMLPTPASLPPEVWADWWQRRQRHHELNRWLLSQAEHFEALAFAQDDTGEFGLNVWEAQALQRQIQALGLKQAWVQTGADELAHTLLTSQVLQASKQQPRVAVHYTHPQHKQALAKFDGLPIEAVVQQRIKACGLALEPGLSQQQADLTLLAHTPAEGLMGDHCGEHRVAALEADDTLLESLKRLAGQPTILVDLAFANGADPQAMQSVWEQGPEWLTGLYGYGAWNTPGNSVGSALALALLRWWAQQQGTFQQQAFQQALATRLLDDWVYQGQQRLLLKRAYPKSVCSNKALTQALLKPIGRPLLKAMGLQPLIPTLEARFPCQRWFEIELCWPEQR
jgi:hypothetical protein